MNPSHPALALAASLLVAAAAAAQPYEARIAFRNDHAADNTPEGTEFTIDSVGTHNFQVLFGAFNAEGFTNRGLSNYRGTLTLADPAANAAIAPRVGGARRAPYAFALAVDGQPGNPINFTAQRSFAPVVVPWPEGQPMPGQPTYSSFMPGDPESGGAPDDLFPGYRFTLSLTDLTPRTITVNASGVMSAVANFLAVNIVPPDGGPGIVEYIPDQVRIVSGINVPLTIHVVPTPASAAILALVPLASISRRRR